MVDTALVVVYIFLNFVNVHRGRCEETIEEFVGDIGAAIPQLLQDILGAGLFCKALKKERQARIKC